MSSQVNPVTHSPPISTPSCPSPAVLPYEGSYKSEEFTQEQGSSEGKYAENLKLGIQIVVEVCYMWVGFWPYLSPLSYRFF